VAKDGRKMSKSLDNAINVQDLLKQYGADVARWWVSSLAYENDVKMDISFFDDAGETYRKVRNTLRFLLSNLNDLDDATEPAVEPESVHAWVLGRAAEVHDRVCEAYDSYAFRRAHQLLYDFCNETLSALYCAAVKDRLYCDRPDAPRRRVTQRVMAELTEMLCRLLAPILPHTADEAFRALRSRGGEPDDAVTVHLETFRPPPSATPDAGWERAMSLRDDALKALESAKAAGLENPLDAGLTLADDGTLAPLQADLADVFGVSRVTLVDSGDPVVVNDLRAEARCDRCWRRDPTAVPRSDGGTLCDRCADAVGV
jgi:isoleucyl-tRNA synthetase